MSDQTTLPPVDTLSTDDVEAKPFSVDWSDVAGEYGDGFDYWEAITCEECGAAIVYGDDHGDVGGEVNGSPEGCPRHGEDARDLYAEGPMMNYAYPVTLANGWDDRTGDPAEAARAIVDLPLCVVEMNGAYYLALTGGGMDLSWEIAAAYVALGNLPPAHFAANLPRMAGNRMSYDGLSDNDRRTFDACRRSLAIAADWATAARDRLDSTYGLTGEDR